MQFSGKKKYKRKTFGEKFVSKAKDIASSRGVKQGGVVLGVAADAYFLDGKVIKTPGRLAMKGAVGGANLVRKTKAGITKGIDRIKNAYNPPAVAKPVGTKTDKKPKRPLRITAGTPAKRLYGLQIGMEPRIVTPAPKPGAVKPSGSIPNRLVNQSTGRPFPKESIAGGKPGTKSTRTVRMPLVRGADMVLR